MAGHRLRFWLEPTGGQRDACGMDPGEARTRLVRLMQLAHAGERAAAHAYQGHWRAVSDPLERAAIQEIEAEEWEHRALVRGILTGLGAAPQPLREAFMGTLGRVIGWSCFVGGWYVPMYGAGKLEAQNVNEYAAAAILAEAAGEVRFLPALRRMAEVEVRHEAWFRVRCASHWLVRWIPLWRQPPPLLVPAEYQPLPSSRPLASAAANARVSSLT